MSVSSFVNNTDTHPSFQKRKTPADFTTNKPSSPKKGRKQQNTHREQNATADEEKTNTQDKQGKNNSPGKQENQKTQDKQGKNNSPGKRENQNTHNKQENKNMQDRQEKPNTQGNCKQERTITPEKNNAHDKKQKQITQEQPKTNPHGKTPQSKQNDTNAEKHQNSKSNKKVCPFCALMLSTRSALTRHIYIFFIQIKIQGALAHTPEINMTASGATQLLVSHDRT